MEQEIGQEAWRQHALLPAPRRLGVLESFQVLQNFGFSVNLPTPPPQRVCEWGRQIQIELFFLHSSVLLVPLGRRGCVTIFFPIRMDQISRGEVHLFKEKDLGFASTNSK